MFEILWAWRGSHNDEVISHRTISVAAFAWFPPKPRSTFVQRKLILQTRFQVDQYGAPLPTGAGQPRQNYSIRGRHKSYRHYRSGKDCFCQFLWCALQYEIIFKAHYGMVFFCWLPRVGVKPRLLGWKYGAQPTGPPWLPLTFFIKIDTLSLCIEQFLIKLKFSAFIHHNIEWKSHSSDANPVIIASDFFSSLIGFHVIDEAGSKRWKQLFLSKI